MLIFPDDERRRKRTPETAEFGIWRRSEWSPRRKGGRTRPHRPSLFLSFFPAFLGVQNSGVPLTCRIEVSPFFALLLLFGEKRLFFYQSKNRKKSNFERYKNNIFSIYRKEEGRKRALKSAHLRRRDGRVLFFSRLSFCLSLSLSLRKTEENPSDDDAKRDDVKPPPFAEKKRDDRHVSVVARAHVRGKSAKKSTTRGGVV